MQVFSATALEKGVRATFFKYFGTEDPAIISKLCETVPSVSDNEKHEWLGQPASMSAFNDEVKYTALSETGYTINNVVYAGGIIANIDDIRRNGTNSIKMRTQQQAVKARGHTVKTLMELIVANGNCYDGGAMFADAHPARKNEGGAQDNKLALTGSTVSNIQTDLGLALAAMLGFKDEEGDPFHGDANQEMDLVVVAAPNLKYNMDTALRAQLISNTSNVNINMATAFYSQRITASDWYLFRTDMFKPFIYQPEQPVRLEEDKTDEISKRQIKYAVSAAYGMGFGFWQSGVSVGV